MCSVKENEMAIKYEKDNTYKTLRELGCKELEGGILTLAERPDKYDDTIAPEEELTFVERRDGKLVFKRANGAEIFGHNNHFDPKAPYNTKEPTKVGTKDSMERKLKAFETRKSCLARAEERRKVQAEKLAAFLVENPDVLAHVEGLEGVPQDGTYEGPSEDARAEARELFARASNE